MDNTKKNVPEIRFPGFTEPWQQRKVTELGKIYIGLVTTMTSHYTDHGALLIRNSDIKDSRFEFGENPIYLDDEFADQNASRKHKIGDVITVHTGDIGTSAVITEKEAGSIGFATIVTRPNQSLILSDYLCAYLNTDAHKNFAMNISTGDGRNNYNLKDYYECIVPVPNIAEQEKIGSVIKRINNLITLHQRKCDELKIYKKGLLQQMFPQPGELYPRIRFPGFTTPWEQRKFGDVARRQSESSISDNENPCIEYEDIISEAGTLNKNVYEKQSRKKGIKFTSNDVLYGKLRPYLHNWLNPEFSGVAVGDWWVLRPVSADKNFLFRLIQTSQYDDAANQSSGTKMPRADWKHVSSIEFMIPTSIEEQSQIAAVFDNLDNLITLHQRKCDEIKIYKNGLLQHMFI